MIGVWQPPILPKGWIAKRREEFSPQVLTILSSKSKKDQMTPMFQRDGISYDAWVAQTQAHLTIC